MRQRLRTLVAPLRQRVLRRLTLAFLVNELGDGITVVVLPLVVYAASGSGLLTGLAFALVRAAHVVGRPVGGLLADRLDRYRVLRASFVGRAILLGMALAVGIDAVTVACLILAGFGGAVDNPSGEAAIREQAGDAPQQVATIRKVSHAMSGVVGLATGGVLVGLVGVEAAIAVDIGTYLVALVVLPPADATSIPRRRTRRRPRAGWWNATRRAVGHSVADSREGIAHLYSHVDLRVIALTNMATAALVTALLTVAVVWLAGLPGAPGGAYGLALAGYSAGSIVGLLVAGLLVWKVTVPRLAWRTLGVCGVICGIGVIGSDWRMLALSWLLWGIAWGPFEVVGDTRLVDLTPSRLLGRAYGGVGMLDAIGQVVGGVIAGAIADVVDPRLVIVGLATTFVVAAVAARTIAMTRTRSPHFDKQAPRTRLTRR